MVNPHFLSFCPLSLSRPVFRPHPALSSDTQSAVLASHVLRAARYFAAGERGSGCFCARTRGGRRRTLVPGDSGGRGHRGAGSLLRGDERSAGEEQAETVQPCKQFWWDSHARFGPSVLSQVNPALTLALLATRRLDVLRALVYITAQCLGACLGAGALYLALPLKTTAEHFVNKVSSGVVDPERSAASRPSAALSGPLLPPQVPLQLNAAQALGVEVLCTFQMVFTVFSVEEQRRRENPEPGNLAIGFAHSAGVLLGVRRPEADRFGDV